MRSILANFPTEQILFHKQSGESFEVNALVGSYGINTEDTSIPKGWVNVGYDALDGKIPGCYKYDFYITIRVRAVAD